MSGLPVRLDFARFEMLLATLLNQEHWEKYDRFRLGRSGGGNHAV